MTEEMNWQHIAHQDPYLAGALAARGWEWWDKRTAEQEADSVGLADEHRADFLRGWNDEIAGQEQEREQQLAKEENAMAAGAEKGDPATWK